jgi:quercetin dioxygenase-like cupin family protein
MRRRAELRFAGFLFAAVCERAGGVVAQAGQIVSQAVHAVVQRAEDLVELLDVALEERDLRLDLVEPLAGHAARSYLGPGDDARSGAETMSTSTTSATHYAWTKLVPDRPMPMLERRRVIGENAMISRVLLQKGCVVPTHAHENEQITCVISGRLRFGLGADGSPRRREVVVAAGEVLHLPANVPHSAEAIEETVVLDVFSPPSEKTGIDR